MLEFIFAPQNFLFLLALSLMLTICLLEIISLFFGAMLSQLFDSLLPDFDSMLTDNGVMGNILGWLHIGRLPMLILIILFLLSFGLIGYVLQIFSVQLFGYLQPGSQLAYLALALALFMVHVGGNALIKVMPETETSAISESSFIGEHVTITLGTASKGSPAEAKFTDHFGQTHYIMVEPLEAEMLYVAGDDLQVVSRVKSVYQVIKI